MEFFPKVRTPGRSCDLTATKKGKVPSHFCLKLPCLGLLLVKNGATGSSVIISHTKRLEEIWTTFGARKIDNAQPQNSARCHNLTQKLMSIPFTGCWQRHRRMLAYIPLICISHWLLPTYLTLLETKVSVQIDSF
jgi:hypothetical protein